MIIFLCRINLNKTLQPLYIFVFYFFCEIFLGLLGIQGKSHCIQVSILLDQAEKYKRLFFHLYKNQRK